VTRMMSYMDSNLFSDILLNGLWQVGCLTLVSAVVLVISRRLQLALRKLALGLLLIAWLLLPIWSWVAVPFDLSLGTIQIANVQSPTEPRIPVENSEVLASQPLVHAGAFSNTSSDPDPISNSQWRDSALLAGGLVWGMGIIVGLIKLLSDQLALSRVMRNLQPVKNPGVLQLWEETVGREVRRNRPQLFATAEIETPFSTGWLRPKVILPEKAIEQWTREELFAAMVHELAHWRQSDLISCRLQRVAQIVHWWNPVVRTLNRELAHVQEVVCDTIAVHASANQRIYASLLIKIAETLRGPSTVPGGALGMARNTSSLEQRIQTITSKGTNMKSIEMKRRNMVLACSTACCLALPVFGVQLAQAEEKREPEAQREMVRVDAHVEDSTSDNVAEIIIKRDGKVRKIRVPLNDEIENARIKDLMEEMKSEPVVDDVEWIEKRKPRSAFSTDDNVFIEESEVIFENPEDIGGVFIDEDGNRTVLRGGEDVDVFIRKKSSEDPFADDVFELEPGTARVVFETDDGEQVIELQRENDHHVDVHADVDFDDDVALFVPEKVEMELHRELSRAQDQIRRSERQAEASMKAQLEALKKSQAMQQQRLQEVMRKQQMQMQNMMKQMQEQMEKLDRENRRIQKQMEKSSDPFSDAAVSR